MFSTRRRHPLTTFRFWFFVLGSAAVTLAWRFDMLPVRIGAPETGQRTDEAFTEVALSESEEWQEPVRQPAHRSESLSGEPFFSASKTPPVVDTTLTAPAKAEEFPVPEANAGVQLYSRSAMAPSVTSPPDLEAIPLADSEAVSDGENRVVPTAAVSDPAASRDAEMVLHADQAMDMPSIDFTEIDRLSQSNSTADHIEAHRKLSSLYWEQPESRGSLQQRIDALAQRIYFQPQPHYMPAYEVSPGDVLQSIGKQHDVTWQYLSKLNQVDPQRIRAGQRLKVIKGPFSAVIDLSEFELTVHAYGYYVTRYPVGIGKDGSSPIGTFTVQNKQLDPTYYGPEAVIEHDDPANPLGERWIDIGNSYGIHGTIDPESIGRSESRGCIRMLNDDVAAVFDLLTVGSEVTIHE